MRDGWLFAVAVEIADSPHPHLYNSAESAGKPLWATLLAEPFPGAAKSMNERYGQETHTSAKRICPTLGMGCGDGSTDSSMLSLHRRGVLLASAFAVRELLFCHREEQRKKDGKGGPARYRPPRRRLKDVATLVVQGEVESFGLLILGNTQTDGHVDDLQNNEAHDTAIHQGR
jgi:hypothetical protein